MIAFFFSAAGMGSDQANKGGVRNNFNCFLWFNYFERPESARFRLRKSARNRRRLLTRDATRRFLCV